MEYKEIEGDLVKLALEGNFEVIAQGNNCFCTQGSGLAPQMVKAFGTNMYPMESKEFKGEINKLGTIDYLPYYLSSDEEDESEVIVVNAYTQYGFGRNHKNGTAIPLDYEALTLCMRKINKIFKGKHIGLPMIGCGLAGGIWSYEELSLAENFVVLHKDVKTIIQEELKDCQVTIVKYKQ